MNRAWRWALIWLMAVVLPLKAVAGVAMVGCGPHHARVVASALAVTSAASGHLAHAAAQDPGVQHDHAAHAAADRGVHRGAGHAAGEATADAAAQSDGGSDAATPAAGGGEAVKCSGCAPCCAAAAPASAAHTLAHAVVSERAPVAAGGAFADVVGDVPRRPPRA